jgi:RND family efflux transporter MFP subunit
MDKKLKKIHNDNGQDSDEKSSPGIKNENGEPNALEIGQTGEEKDDFRHALQPGDDIPKSGTSRRKYAAITALTILLLILLAIGILPRIRRQSELAAASENVRTSVPVVNVVKAERPGETSEITLPGSTEAIEETAIAPRVSGYVRRRFVDIGSRVSAGQILAEIDTPELDREIQQARAEAEQARQDAEQARQEIAQARQQLEQARAVLKQGQAALLQARTNAELATVSWQRSANLLAQGVVSRQEVDERRTTLDVRRADIVAAEANISERQSNIKAQQANISAKESIFNSKRENVDARLANVSRLEALKGFSRVTAPFAGVITARQVDTGSLVSAGGAGEGGGGMFRLARTDVMRAIVNLPQTYAQLVNPGLEAEVEIRELSQQKFTGRVARTASAFDQNSRTQRVEVILANENGQLAPGMFAQVKFSLTGAGDNILIIPASALVIGADGTRVAVVGKDKMIRFQPVKVGRDTGGQIEITEGLEGGEDLVANPSQSLTEGMTVQIAAPPENTSS